MGKTVTSYPPTRGENSLESIKGAELPQRFIFGLRAGKTKQGKAGEAGRRDKARQRQQRGRGGASTLSRVFPLLRSTGGQTSGPRFAVMTSSKLGRGGAVGWPQAQRCQELPELSRVSRFPFWASIP